MSGIGIRIVRILVHVGCDIDEVNIITQRDKTYATSNIAFVCFFVKNVVETDVRR